MRVDGVLLDIDGTLWDSTGVVADVWTQAAREEKQEGVRLTPQIIRGQFGKTMDEIARSLFPGASEEQQARLMEACCRREQQALRESDACLLYPGVRETMEALSASYRLFVVSNCQKGYINLFLSKNRFTPLITDFECYGNNGNAKGPNIRLVVERNHLRAPVYVGDTLLDQQAAAFAGIPFIFAAYGFGRATKYAAKINSFAELPAVLLDSGASLWSGTAGRGLR